MPLSDDEIRRITRAVIDRLGEQPGTPTVSEVDEAARRPMETPDTPSPSPSLPTGPAHAASHPVIEPSSGERQRVIVATFGRNRPGVAAALTGVLAEHNCDIADITQKILQEFFSMIMIVDISGSSVDFATLREKFREIESRLGVTIVAQHEDVFRAMHRI